MKEKRLSTRDIAFMAVFAALYVVSSLLPGIPIVGLPELKIELEAALASIFGIVLGPYLGFSTALLGTLIAWILPPGQGSVYGLPFLLNPSINALMSGFIYTGRWREAFAIFAGFVIGFMFTPVCQPIQNFYYVWFAGVWDKVIAMLLILPISRSLKSSPRLVSRFTFFSLLAFVGNQADGMFGNIIFATPPVYEGIFTLSLEITRGLYLVSPFFYPAIRVIQAILAGLIAVPLMRALTSVGLVGHWKRPVSPEVGVGGASE
ncbi:MAG: ECF transporter S component [Candidatus Bathyarchaeia archaeon]